MLAKVLSSTVIGIDACPVEVEVDISRGLPVFTTVGLAETAVKESKERVKAALVNSGFSFSDDRITVNLAPAAIKKTGTGYDLPIALGILAASGLMAQERLADFLILGELSLDGRIKPVSGVLPMALAAREAGLPGILVPVENRREAAVVSGISVYPVHHLSEAVGFLEGTLSLSSETMDVAALFASAVPPAEDFSEVAGQENAKRALEIAAAGGHNLVMIGAPGAGKTMLARRLPTILPEMSFAEAIETTKIFSVAGHMNGGFPLITRRPFRAPHHTISDAGLIGGGGHPKPGEISLAHNGVLFLDEFPEFKKPVLEMLRQPMEDKTVTISRATMSTTYPSAFMLVAAMNPCPCGYLGDSRHVCACSDSQIRRYQARISGPLLDRIDIHVEVPAVAYTDLVAENDAEPSSEIKKRVVAARQIQAERFAPGHIHCNGRMSGRHLKKYCQLNREPALLLQNAVDRLGLSARAYTRILKVSRTIADLEASAAIAAHHVAEAVQARRLDRK